MPPVAPSPPAVPPVAWLPVNVLWLTTRLPEGPPLVSRVLVRIAPAWPRPPLAPAPPAPPVAWLPVKAQESMRIEVRPARVTDSSRPPPLPLPPTRPVRPAPPVARLSETVLWHRRNVVRPRLNTAPPWPSESSGANTPPVPPVAWLPLSVLWLTLRKAGLPMPSLARAPPLAIPPPAPRPPSPPIAWLPVNVLLLTASVASRL